VYRAALVIVSRRRHTALQNSFRTRGTNSLAVTCVQAWPYQDSFHGTDTHNEFSRHEFDQTRAGRAASALA